jgi:TonB family protein
MRKAYRSSWLIAPAVILSGVAQGGALAVYELTRPETRPFVTVVLVGDGSGEVVITDPERPQFSRRCAADRCRLEVARGSQVHLRAVPAEGATFEGWRQLPQRTPPALVPFLGDPLARCGETRDLLAAARRDVRECAITVVADVEIEAHLGLIPDEIEVAWAQPGPMPAMPEVAGAELPELPDPIDAEKLEDPEIVVALVKPPEPEIKLVLPKPPPREPAARPPAPPPQDMPNLRSVEVPDDHEVEKAPDDAVHLSDKNRDVAEETHATATNLEKEIKGEHVASRESDVSAEEAGVAEDDIAQLEESEATSDLRAEPSDHSGDSQLATGAIVGEEGRRGEEGRGEVKEPGVLSMRDIGGRGSIVDQNGDGKREGKKGKPGLRNLLAFEDYERIMGREQVERERDLAARKISGKKGRWERKLAAIKSSLENFAPDVRPGNQTALKTRAHPFAVYLARMHRRIHELWGFGFLEDLDDKAASHPLNNFDLFVSIEVAVNPDGTVHKTTIARTSGSLEFDVAALDTLLTASPYPSPPETIRSVDGRVYLRWGFYRNYRQCGTFNVEPYILTEIPGGAEPLDDGKMVKNLPKRGNRPVTPSSSSSSPPAPAPTSTSDTAASFAANLWASGFATGTVDKMVKFSAVPFFAGGQVAAQTPADLKSLYEGLLVESGAMKEWKLLTGEEYRQRTGSAARLPDHSVLMLVEAASSTFAIVMTRQRSGEYRATQLVR